MRVLQELLAAAVVLQICVLAYQLQLVQILDVQEAGELVVELLLVLLQLGLALGGRSGDRAR